MNPIIVLMNGGLRLDDQPALAAAAAKGAPILPLFVMDDAAHGQWAMGAASRWWLRQSLTSLSQSFEDIGSRLILRTGDTADVADALVAETGASGLYMLRGYSPTARKLEAVLHDLCAMRAIECRRFSGSLLIEPEHIATGGGTPYTVFTPFWRRARELVQTFTPTPAPKRLSAPDTWPESTPLAALKLDPVPAAWAEPIAANWLPGEAGARVMLEKFVAEVMVGYKAGRDIPGTEGTSRLSPYLAHGEISIRRIWHACQKAAALDEGAAGGSEAYLREIGWREFAHHLLYHFPDLPQKNLKAQFDAFPWREGDGAALKEWRQGLTGFPIVDAGMRELWQTGWMHNRVRMIVASFLVKDLLWHWHDGAKWFWDTLVDADLANNTMGWQWVAGCGPDAAPYFRIFNPITQGEKFDPDGAYVRRFVPELAALPDAYIHKPFEAPAEVLRAAGVTLGVTYPKPMVDRKLARERALAALASTRADQVQSLCHTGA
ncbi:cryptochrome/photolyase family protein [Kordiimonas marina]|uniref:cryptochrome/photolyase family protein n=1 Tax=Kordiimonas marina TaxID=2872312 RepID=UPI001FF50528|nr:deoxyribodipyrimidine photo-lyase [Kordiimonas marina]MCJ9430688.1 DNA photolyase family protein [Kordiimonas marina]